MTKSDYYREKIKDHLDALRGYRELLESSNPLMDPSNIRGLMQFHEGHIKYYEARLRFWKSSELSA